MKFDDFLLNWKRKNNFPHCLIVKNNFCCNFKTISLKYLKSLTCSDTLFCDECDTCIKINNDYYVDFIYIENTKENPIKKEDVINIENRFKYDATGNNIIKLYVIKNIDNANKQVINALLKFIEEPPNNTYALFFCNNEYNILPTIRSRSQLIYINDFESISNDNKEIENIQSIVFNDVNEWNNFSAKFDFEYLYLLAKKIQNISNITEEVKIFNELKLLDKNQINVLLKILLEFCNINQKPKIIDLIASIKLNMNKNTFVVKLLNEMK